jgi:hypothetical protein
MVQFNAAVVRELKTAVLARAAAILDGGEYEATNEAVLEAKATLTGLSTAAEFWQLIETENMESRQKEQNYVYYIVYSIRPDIWDGITAKYLADVVGKVPDTKTQQKVASMFKELQEDTKREQVRSDAQFELELRAQEAALTAAVKGNAATQQAALKSGDPAQIASAVTTAGDTDFVAALRAAAGVNK